jgi:hypothetical protein
MFLLGFRLNRGSPGATDASEKRRWGEKETACCCPDQLFVSVPKIVEPQMWQRLSNPEAAENLSPPGKDPLHFPRL